jgi:hypothetical protein
MSVINEIIDFEWAVSKDGSFEMELIETLLLDKSIMESVSSKSYIIDILACWSTLKFSAPAIQMINAIKYILENNELIAVLKFPKEQRKLLRLLVRPWIDAEADRG